MADQPWVGVKFRLVATIGGVTFTDIIQFTSLFELNTLPQASLTVATGRNIETGKPASIHGELKAVLLPMAPAQVFLEIAKHGGENLPYELTNVKRIQVWDGTVSGSGWTRNMEAASYTIHLAHWLADLNNSSAMSSSIHPHCPHDLAHAAVFPGGAVSASTAGGGPIWVPVVTGVDSASLEADVWLKLLRPILDSISKQDLIKLNVPGSGTALGGNDAATRALDRMKNTSKYAIPVAMDLRGADGQTITEGVRNAVTKEIAANWVHTTLWGKLIGEWAPSYFFSVVPRVMDALVVPFAGSLKKEFKTINEGEYTHFQWITQNTQILQAVGIFHSGYMDAGGNGALIGDEAANYAKIGGWWPDDTVPKDKRGVQLLKEAPRWLQDLTRSSLYSADAADAEAEEGTGHACDPGKGTAPTQPTNPKQKIESVYPLLDQYARHWFVLETLKGRTAELAGKLRFDLAPGSTVKITGRGARFVQNDLTAVPLFASVARVSIGINSESQRAGTSFTLAHVRTEQENQDPKMAIDKPPLYKQAWTGAALLDDY